MSEIEENKEEKIYYKIEAKRTREKIVEIIKEIFGEDNYKSRTDLKWLYATMSICSFALDRKEDFEKYKNLFENVAEAKWELNTFEDSLKHIKLINKG